MCTNNIKWENNEIEKINAFKLNAAQGLVK